MVTDVQALHKLSGLIRNVIFDAGRLREEDKQKHFWLSFALVAMFYPWVNLAWAALMVLLLGLLKELVDHRFGTGFCWYDMGANGLGLSAGMMFCWALALTGNTLF